MTVNQPEWVSRYQLDSSSLTNAAINLQVGQGIADRISSIASTTFIAQAEDWADQMVSDFIMTPLQPIRALGQTSADFQAAKTNSQLTQRNYPVEFIQAIIYRALNLMLNSEYFENAPNVSEAGKWAEAQSEKLIGNFRDRSTYLVGAGHRRNPNPHMPPSIAPKQPKQQF